MVLQLLVHQKNVHILTNKRPLVEQCQHKFPSKEIRSMFLFACFYSFLMAVPIQRYTYLTFSHRSIGTKISGKKYLPHMNTPINSSGSTESSKHYLTCNRARATICPHAVNNQVVAIGLFLLSLRQEYQV